MFIHLTVASFLIFSFRANASQTQVQEREFLKEDVQCTSGGDWRQLPLFPVSALLTRQGDWLSLKSEFSKSPKCKYYWSQIEKLESDIQISARRAYDFSIYKKDPLISSYFKARLFLDAYFLRRLTQIFENGYEGGGDIQAKPVSCVIQNRTPIVGYMLQRDLLVYLNLRQSLGGSMINPLAVGFEEFEKIQKTLGQRHAATRATLALAGAYLGYKNIVNLSSSALLPAIEHSLIRRAISSMALAVPLFAYHIAQDEPEIDFSMINEKDPQSLWEKTMARIYLVLNRDLGSDVIEGFLNLQNARRAQAAQIH